MGATSNRCFLSQVTPQNRDIINSVEAYNKIYYNKSKSWYKDISFKFFGHAILGHMRLCKAAPQCESQNNATFNPHIASFLRKGNSFVLSIKTQDVQCLKKGFFFKYICLCSEPTLNFYFLPFFLATLTPKIHKHLN